MSLALDSRHIHLWCVFISEIGDPELLDSYRELLDRREQDQERSFDFPRDRKRFLLTRALVRTVLSRYAEVAPEDWSFTNNRYGRPDIATTDPNCANLSFNISHTAGLIALGVTREQALGVDIESFRTRSAPIALAGRFFATEEVAALRALPEERRQQRFFEYWTLKESYIKARGMGLSIPLGQFCFRFSGKHAVEIDIHPNQLDDPARWRFWQLQLASDYLLAVCCERVQREAPRLTLRKVVPTVCDELLEGRLLRSPIW